MLFRKMIGEKDNLKELKKLFDKQNELFEELRYAIKREELKKKFGHQIKFGVFAIEFDGDLWEVEIMIKYPEIRLTQYMSKYLFITNYFGLGSNMYKKFIKENGLPTDLMKEYMDNFKIMSVKKIE